MNILKYSLPLNERNKFPQLFAELEKIKDIQVTLQMANLEEVFEALERNLEGEENSNHKQTQENETLPAMFSDKSMM